MADNDRPLLNPVLALRIEPKRDAAPGRGKEEKHVVRARLQQQRVTLSRQIEELAAPNKRLVSFGGKVQLLARMFPDSYAPSHTPLALFNQQLGLQLVAPYRDGYVIEATVDRLPQLISSIRTSDSVGVRVDISRVQGVQLYNRDEILHGRTIESIWETAPQFDRGRGFIVTWAPFRSFAAKEQLLQSIAELAREAIVLPTYPTLRFADEGEKRETVALPVVSVEQSSLAIAMRRYRTYGRARATVQIASSGALIQLVASGSVFRIDPIPRLEVTTPGEGEHPGPLPPQLKNEPIVGVVDGGRTARTYDQAEAWREVPLIPNGIADTKHGNRVTALIVHGHTWNTNLVLPQLFCRVGTVQAVPKSDAAHVTDIQQLMSYLGDVIARHPETKVWNFSCNQPDSCDPNQVSYLGHELSRLSRHLGVLPIVSAGNRPAAGEAFVAPPADCEAALVVAGRQFNESGDPSDPCETSRYGPGPEGMLKPDLSWFSKLRVLGGDVLTATSYCTPLVSSLAAHTFSNLKNATPDLVRALIINRTDLARFDYRRGWGSPSAILPWTCESGAVTLAWVGEMQPGQEYYWEQIPIPASLTHDGRLKGRGALTAILEPIVSDDLGGNYFSSRMEVALQYKGRSGETKNLLGPMRTDPMTEAEARAQQHKWNPLRRHCRDFSSSGLLYSGNMLRLRARVFARDIYQFGVQRNEDINPLRATFVLTLSDGSETSDLYNEMRVGLGNFVESAVIEQEIEIDG